MGGWQPVTHAEAAYERYEGVRHFMTDPRTVTGMADREQDALVCAARRREREARPVDLDRYACRCDHDHPPDVPWCDLCENPVFHSAESEMTMRMVTGWRFVAVNADGVPLSHGEPMVEYEPGKWMDATAAAGMNMMREWCIEHGQKPPAS
jgi:hypothetical protein